MGDLIAELESLRDRIRAARERAPLIVGDMDDETFNRAPADGKWSVCECFDHLNLVGEKVGERIDDAIAAAHREGKYGRGPFRYSWFGRKFVEAASGDNYEKRRRVPTFGVYLPRPDQSVTNVMSAFDTLQKKTIERIEAANGIHLSRVTFPSPATRLIRLPLGLWLEMIAGHQERHMRQAEEVVDAVR